MDWSDLFVNPATMAVGGYLVATFLRILWESPERKLPAWFPFVVAAVVAVVIYSAGAYLSPDQQAQIIDVLALITAVLGAGGISLVVGKQQQRKHEQRNDAPRGFAAASSKSEKPSPWRTW